MMRLADENLKNGLQLLPGSHGMDFPSACTIVLIAGFRFIDIQARNAKVSNIFTAGKYISKVDRLMTQVDRITEDIDHMPVAAFIFRDQESDEVHFSADIR